MVTQNVAPEQYSPRPLRWDRPVPASLQRVADQQLAALCSAAGLTRRQRRAWLLLRRGLSDHAIGLRLGVSEPKARETLETAKGKLREYLGGRAGLSASGARDIVRALRNRFDHEVEVVPETGEPPLHFDGEATAVHGRPWGAVAADLIRREAAEEPGKYLLWLAERLTGQASERPLSLVEDVDEFRGRERAEWLKKNTGTVRPTANV